MRRTSIIKGKPIYLYKHSQYVYQPEKTIIRKMRHDEIENITFVYCSKPTLIPEIIMVIILVLFAIFNTLLNINDEVIYYNDKVIYYNNLLYLNIKSEDTNYYEMYYDLSDSSGNSVAGGYLQPGDLVTTVSISDPDDYYTLKFMYKTLLGFKEREVDITVINKDEKSIDGVNENGQ